MVGCWVLHALVLRRYATRSRVVVGSVVRRRAPAMGGVDRPCDQDGPVRPDYRLRCLYLDLKSESAVQKPIRLLDSGGREYHRFDLCDRGDLRQGHHEPVGKATLAHELSDEEAESGPRSS